MIALIRNVFNGIDTQGWSWLSLHSAVCLVCTSARLSYIPMCFRKQEADNWSAYARGNVLLFVCVHEPVSARISFMEIMFLLLMNAWTARSASHSSVWVLLIPCYKYGQEEQSWKAVCPCFTFQGFEKVLTSNVNQTQLSLGLLQNKHIIMWNKFMIR